MNAELRDRSGGIDWGMASRALPGEVASGDRYLVQPHPGGVLLAVVDGLGHGAEAAAAAQRAIDLLALHAQETLLSLVNRCHEALIQTRGAVMSLAALDSSRDTITWLGVGNVEGILLRGEARSPLRYEAVMQRGGVVGYQLPPLKASTLSITAGDLLIFATDGIGNGFAQGVALSETPQRIADQILAEYAKGVDDALVLVARYRGADR